jgi:hypothetical protein
MPTSDSRPDPLNGQLTELAAVIPVDDVASSLTSVRETVAGRRRRRNIIGGGFAAAVLIAAGVVVLGTVSDGDGSDTIAIEGAGDDEPADEGPGGVAQGEQAGSDAASDETPTDNAPGGVVTVSVPTRQVSAITTGPTRVALGVGEGDMADMVEWIVPWQGGFLAASTTYAPQPLPAELPEEIIALFPPEVVDFFDGELPPTIDEATLMLSEAGLLDEVAAVVQSNPAAYEAIYGAAGAATEPETDVVFSSDGVDWEPIDFVAPEGMYGLYGVQSTGTRLAVATQLAPEVTPFDTARPDQTAPIVVATTTDLITWDVVELDVGGRPAGLPEVITYGIAPSELAINDNGWLLSVDSFSDIDIAAVLPEAIRDEVVNGSGGYGTSWDDSGVQIEVYGDAPVETVPTSDDEGNFGDPEVAESFTFTWDELGVDPAAVAMINGGGGGRQLFTSTWGGEPVEVDDVEGWSIAAGDDGFYVSRGDSIEYSADAITWTTIALPDDVYTISSIKTLPDGIVALGGDDAGASSLYRWTGSTATWERLEVPGAPPSMSDVFGGMGSAPAMIVDGTERQVPEPTEITVEADGFTMVMRQDFTTASVVVTNRDGTVVAQEAFDWRAGDQPASWRYGNNGVEIIDTDTGELIVTFDNDVMEAAYREQTDQFEQPDELAPDLWLLATSDGERWLVEDLDVSIDDSRFGPGGIAISNDVLLVNSGDGWDRYDLS